MIPGMHSSSPAPDEEVEVLVIGGSLVGLSTAMFLGIHGIRALAVERHASTAIHPRAGHFQLRTSEVLRSAGLEERVRQRSEEQYLPNGGINNVESLAGREIASYFANLNDGVQEFSPTIRMFIDQDALEPMGIAGPELLESYDAERRAIGELTVEQAYTRYVTRVAPYLGTDGMQDIVDDWSMEIGYRYNSAAVALEPGDGPGLHEHPRDSRGRPGSRAPHVPVQRAGTALSTLDLFGTAFVLLAGPDGEAWRESALRAGEALDVPLDAYVVGGGEVRDPGAAFAAAYGISAAGAVLVRPDGFVAWRARDAAGASDEVLQDVLTALLLRQRG